MIPLGFAWHMWRRHRISLTGFSVYFLFLLVLVRVLPASELKPDNFGPGAFIPLTGLLFTLMAAFINPDADIAATNSAYPSWFFLLPVKTRDLALWPFLIGAASLVLVWLTAALGIMIPAGIHAPLWPAALLVAILAVLQALFWTPFPIPYLRSALAVTLLPIAIVAAINAFMQGVSPAVITAICLVVAITCHLLSAAGLQTGRNGTTVDRLARVPDRAARRTTATERTSFKSIMAAQTWLELNRNGLVLPVVTLCICTLFSLPLLWTRDMVTLIPWDQALAGIQANVTTRVQMYIPFLIVFSAMVFGCGVRKADQRRQDYSLLPFLVARPITSGQIVLAKMVMAAKSALAAWSIAFVFACLFLLLPAQEGDNSGPLGLLLLTHATPKAVFVFAGVVTSLLVLTWRNQVDSLCLDLCGMPWLINGFAVGISILGVAAMIFGANLIADPDLQKRLIRQLPAIVQGLAAVKLVFASVAVRALVVMRVLSAKQFATAALVWLAAFAVTTLAMESWTSSTRAMSISGAFLMLPLVRISLAPLALERNRHR